MRTKSRGAGHIYFLRGAIRSLRSFKSREPVHVTTGAHRPTGSWTSTLLRCPSPFLRASFSRPWPVQRDLARKPGTQRGRQTARRAMPISPIQRYEQIARHS